MGPLDFESTIDLDFHPRYPKEKRPNFYKELKSFAINPFTKKPFKISDFIKFIVFDEKTHMAEVKNEKGKI